MPEWLIGAVLKPVVPSRVPRVRIPIPPPFTKKRPETISGLFLSYLRVDENHKTKFCLGSNKPEQRNERSGNELQSNSCFRKRKVKHDSAEVTASDGSANGSVYREGAVVEDNPYSSSI